MKSPQFKVTNPEKITDNPFKLIGSDWMLITAGSPQAFNTMTASWGGMGIIWNKKVCFCVVRPTRHTRLFTERSGYFTLSFFEERYRDVLNYCGSHSGRDVDKIKETGLTPVFGDNTVYFAEARLVFECKKVYYQDIDPGNFLDPAIDQRNYPLKDYHRLYVGEIVSCLVR
jgi:flavin reductase (DIM6/NTAB) family NADH-FMN oxidoreductase RutF